MNTDALLEIRGLNVDYRTSRRSTVPVLRDIDLSVRPGEAVALVGESGCGKTTLALAMLRLLPKLGQVRSGSIGFRSGDGEWCDLLAMDGGRLRRFRWAEAAMVYQGAMNALNPLTRIRSQFLETARAHRSGDADRVVLNRAAELLELVALEPGRVLNAYPHQLSGGMRQRVLIALALLLRPRLLVLDEPTTALDILTQRGIVDTLIRLKDELRFAMVFVSHDLPLAAELADRVATMYGGRIVELGPTRELFYRPRHPYTMGLIRAVPPVAADAPEIVSIPGSPPGFGALPPGCAFHPRCRFAGPECAVTDVPLTTLSVDHRAACLRLDATDLEAVSHRG
ncbi:ABC transporter ATP-binding protein [Jiangella alba]|uniref:Peptide/nickel transport system ATP-binding protein n=1 Tax=Jiangella alba TaxID=561176 RepID=A0A1H5PVX5_9ACTN|nr:ABC transporter ATP-binding protein [Jiangella alba]SEF17990.1 peptide/nickel transport system ATP-binding protein [Jiangella alba]